MLASVEIEDVPRVAMRKRARYTRIAPGIIQVRLHFGFMDHPDVPAALQGLTVPGYGFEPDDATYFLGRESVTATDRPGMLLIREQLFAAMNRSASSAARFFGQPPRQVFEVGTQVEI